MWKIIEFDTLEELNKWIISHSNYQYSEVFVDNGYALEVRKNREILID